MSFLGYRWPANLANLAAIRHEGEHLEYTLPASVANAIGMKQALAACFSSTEDFLRAAGWQAAKAGRTAAHRESSQTYYAQQEAKLQERQMTEEQRRVYAEAYARAAQTAQRSQKLAKGKADALASTLSLVEKELAELRASGVTGPIPVCVYRASGKMAASTPWQVLQNQSHERFHAAMRRLEARLGLASKGAYLALDKMMNEVYGDTGIKIATLAKWSSRANTITEELLARVEEQAVACASGTDNCRGNVEYNSKWIDFVNSRYKLDIPRTYLETLTTQILNDYGSAMKFVEAAVQRYPNHLDRKR